MNKDNRLQQLLRKISEWTDWKMKALILDESDLEVKKIVEKFKDSSLNKDSDMIGKVNEDLSNWPQWKKEAYNEMFVSAHSTKLE